MKRHPDRLRPRFSRSIKGRLVALFVLLALAMTAVFLLGSQRWLQTGWVVFVQPLARDYAQRLTTELGTPPNPGRARQLADRLPLAIEIDGPLVRFRTHEEPFENSHGQRHPQRDTAWLLPVTASDGHRVRFALVAPPDMNKPRYVGWATLAALLGLIALAYAAVRRQFKPLDAIGAGVQAYGAGRFDQAIPVRRNDELGELAVRINSMAHSLHGMLNAKRALLLAMSHELRSPLTRARVNAELLDDSTERSALLRDLGDMRDLISSLLEGERLSAGHSALQTEDTDLITLAREAAAAHSRHPEARSVTLQLPAPGTAWARRAVDPQRVRLLLRNLLENAQRHGNTNAEEASTGPGSGADAGAGAGAAVELFLRTEPDGRSALGVRDHGPGVPAEQLQQLGQAFYRPDSARTRASGGVGLGLHLCRLVAQAHQGELRLRNVEPGLEVAMVW